MIITNLDLQLFVTAIRNNSNYDFREYSDKSLKRRFAKVLADYKLDVQGIVGQMRNNHEFVEQVVRDITVNTTELFRDPHIWQHVKYVLLPKWKNQQTINIWHAGCSYGQEVYSMLMMLYELGLYEKARVFATDINSDVITGAKKGVYKYKFNLAYLDNFDKALKINPFNSDEHIDVPYSKYFDTDQEKDLLKMKPFLLEKPSFKIHNLVNDSNIFYVKFDLIVCRNVIIYFNYDLQNKIFDLFYNNLYNNGFLWLGMHESMLGPFTAKFEKYGYFYQKKENLFFST